MPLTSVAPGTSLRRLSRSLSGYLCGTHSGMLRYRAGDRLDPSSVARLHRELKAPGSPTTTLGERPWEPGEGARDLAASLDAVLDRSGIVDLILFGSQAKGSVTGFSDVDAVLVLENSAAEDPSSMRRLRRHVLAAQRAVLAHQPMQHHGFAVATPRLLLEASDALALPPEALSETRSLTGNAVDATFSPDDPRARVTVLRELIRSTGDETRWPRHPWRLHRLISMFELIPALYLQGRGVAVEKSRSFDEARSDFGDGWWPYDVLREVRERWPRRALPALRRGASAARNPWVAVAAWRRLPVAADAEIRGMLTQDCLEALRAIAHEMSERVS
jgi:hypothetical protein